MLDPELDQNSSGGKNPEIGSLSNYSASNDPPTVFSSSTKVAASVQEAGDTTELGNGGSKTTVVDQMPVSGTKIGIYELGPPIGHGGMATVYAAQELSLERTVALKILPPKSSQDGEILQRFILEGKAAAQLDHPNIAKIHALGHDGSFYYLAFEYVEGRTVRQWIEDKGRIEVDQALDWSIQVAQALSHADSRGVVHRDIKPSNLIVSPSGLVKLVDLGLARRHEIQGQVELTQSGVTLGTFDYISPEQARDPRSVDIRSDLYSLGCTMFHMLSGRPPFPVGNVVQKLLQHQEQAPEDLRALNPDVPDALAELVRRLMAKSPFDRPASPENCIKELQKIRDERVAKATLGAQNTNDVEPGTIRGLLTWIVPAAVLASVVTLASWLGGQGYLESKTSGPGNGAAANSNGVMSSLPVEPAEQGKKDALTATPVLNPPQAPPTIYWVETGASLVEAIKAATAGSVIVLTEPGPYEISISEIPLIEQTDLTIRGENGVKPVIKAVIDQRNEPDQLKIVDGLFQIRSSRVQFQNLTMDLRDESGTWVNAAISATESDVTVRELQFLTDHAAQNSVGSFVSINKDDSRINSAWRPVRIEKSRFFGNRAAVRMRGPVELFMNNSAQLGSEPLVWVEESERETPWPCMIQLDHVSVKATGWTPILELNDSAARIRVQNCVFAPRPGGQISLVSSRRPSRMDWFGRENLYGEVTSFLESTRFDDEILDFETWSQSDSTVREQNSLATRQSIYSPVDSAPLVLQGRWADAFTLNRGPWSDLIAGVRSWTDPNQRSMNLVEDSPENPLAEKPVSTDRESQAKLTDIARINGDNVEVASVPKRANQAENTFITSELEAAPAPMPMPMPMPMQVTEPAASESKPNSVASLAEKTKTGAEVKSIREQEELATERSPTLETARSGIGQGRSETRAQFKSAKGSVNEGAENLFFRNLTDSEELRLILRENSRQGATISLADGSLIRILDIQKIKGGRWVFNAEPGLNRPKLSFGSLNKALVEGRARWTLEPGVSIRLRGIDIEWDANEPAQQRLFEVSAGAQLVLEDCTVTLRGNRSDLILFATVDAEANAFDEPTGQRATIRLIDSIVRTAGSLFVTSGEVRSDVEFTGSLAVVNRPLLTIQPLGQLQTAQTTRLQLNQSTVALGSSLATIRLGRGLVEQPHLECQVRRTILAGNPNRDGALLEVRGGGAINGDEEFISWEGEEVAYENWTTYRLDQDDFSGTLARRQNREDWQLSHLEDDSQSLHGEAGLLNQFWASGHQPWEAVPEDFRIAGNSPAQGLGARLDRLPSVSLAKGSNGRSVTFPER